MAVLTPSSALGGGIKVSSVVLDSLQETSFFSHYPYNSLRDVKVCNRLSITLCLFALLCSLLS